MRSARYSDRIRPIKAINAFFHSTIVCFCLLLLVYPSDIAAQTEIQDQHGALMEKADSLLEQQRFNEAARIFQEATQRAVTSSEKVDAMIGDALARINAPDKVEARRLLLQAKDLTLSSDDLISSIDVLFLISVTQAESGDVTSAIETLSLAVDRAGQIEAGTNQALADFVHASLYLDLTDYHIELSEYSSAARMLDQAMPRLQSLNDPVLWTVYHYKRGVVATQLNQLELAKREIGEAIQNLEDITETDVQISILLAAIDLAERRSEQQSQELLIRKLQQYVSNVEERSGFAARPVMRLSEAFENDPRSAAFGLSRAFRRDDNFRAPTETLQLANTAARLDQFRNEAEIRSLYATVAALIAIAVLIAGFAISMALRRKQQSEFERYSLEMKATLAERMRIARELHDTLLQDFTATGLHIELAKSKIETDPKVAHEILENALIQSDEALRSARLSIIGARSDFGNDLSAAVSNIVDAFRLKSDINITLENNLNGPPIDTETCAEICRIVDEAISNAVTHAQAENIRVETFRAADLIKIFVNDDGMGFDPNSSLPGHYGLTGMRERAKLINALFSIDSSAGTGSVVRLEIRQS